MKVLFILGHKLNKEGGISNSFRRYLKHAGELIGQNSYDKIIISGGRTEKRSIWSEAMKGAKYLRSSCGVKRSIRLEERAANMSENFIYFESLVHYESEKVEEITIVGRRLWKLRAKSILARSFFPYLDPKAIHYESPSESAGFFEYPREAWNCFYALLDPRSKNPLVRLGLRIFRNRHRYPFSVS